MKTIGFVCEGPRDVELLSAVLRRILQEDINPLFLQPEDNLQGGFGNGWKGVWRWCEKEGWNLDKLMNGVSPKMDALIIQMDGDVSRKEKEPHCRCGDICEDAGNVHPLACRKVKENCCPIILPCGGHESGAPGYVRHLTGFLSQFFQPDSMPIFVIPCDSTDAWIVAAFDAIEDTEHIANPWESVISVGKNYHGIRIHRHKKLKAEYAKLISMVCENWERVTAICSQAMAFEQAIRVALL